MKLGRGFSGPMIRRRAGGLNSFAAHQHVIWPGTSQVKIFRRLKSIEEQDVLTPA
jgi:hypothetical protein